MNAAALSLALLLIGASGQSQRPAAVAVDHIILGASDLDSAVLEFERLTGVRPAYGGAHPGRGTRNALVALDDGAYLEILAPDPEQNNAPQVAELIGMKRMAPVGWAARTAAAAPLRARLVGKGFRAGPLTPGSRKRPDGQEISWVTFELSGLDQLVAPFFIQWRTPAQHPSRTAPRGCSLRQLAIATPDAERMKRLVALLGLNLPLARQRASKLSVTLVCPKGRIRF